MSSAETLPPSSPAVAASPPPAPQTDERVSILLVDDRPDKLMALEAILAGLGERLVLAGSGKEALRCLLRQDFAAILLDVNMPVMDGFETAALIRQRKNSELTPIIFVSAINDAENHLSRGYSLGAVDYMLAPVVPEILRAKVGFFVDLFKKTEQVKRQAEERAEFIREQAARTEAEAAEKRAAFLAEASRALAASLDDAETFRNVAALAVPMLADLCIVDTLGRDGVIRTVAIHADPGVAAQVEDARRRCPLCLDTSYFIPKVLRTGESEVMTDLSDPALDAAGWAPEHRAILRELGICAYAVVPLVARGRTLGAISLIMAGSGRTYGSREISLAEAIASRAAFAVDNALLYAAARDAREAAESANHAKDRFLAMLSHELRTPLTPVLNTVQALEGSNDLPPDLRAALEMIRRNVELEGRLIDDLLDLTRISKGKVQLRLETVDAHVLIGTALDICGDEIRAKQLVVAAELNAREHHLRADAARLHQVFWNLLKNAVKFTPSGGRLTVSSTNPQPGRVRFEIADTGIGIPSEALPKIFDAFEQGSRAGQGGLGLGLAIAKAIVDLHDGVLAAESAGPGRGTTFTLELATTTAAPAASAAALLSGNGGSLSSTGEKHAAGEAPAGPRVLLVDDHADTLRSMNMLLRQRGYLVCTAPSVAAALAAAAANEFDLLISDVGLPDGSGMDLMSELRTRHGRNLPGIALSGYGMEEDIARSHAVGFGEHLTKPVDMLTLETAMRRLLAAG
jgi:signal transduction histidine kinase/DNA-binding response OmpR family regulator